MSSHQKTPRLSQLYSADWCQSYSECAIDLYRDEVRGVMLERIVMFGSDPQFQTLVVALADDIKITKAQAARLLWPTSHAVYRAAEAAKLCVDAELESERAYVG